MYMLVGELVYHTHSIRVGGRVSISFTHSIRVGGKVSIPFTHSTQLSLISRELKDVMQQ